MTDLDRLLELAEKKGLWTNEYTELKEKIRHKLEENTQLKTTISGNDETRLYYQELKEIQSLKSQLEEYGNDIKKILEKINETK